MVPATPVLVMDGWILVGRIDQYTREADYLFFCIKLYDNFTIEITIFRNAMFRFICGREKICVNTLRELINIDSKHALHCGSTTSYNKTSPVFLIMFLTNKPREDCICRGK